jgi:hypothetical protein
MNQPYFLLFLSQFTLSAALLGILWFVQLIHYPLYGKIKEDFVKYEKEHIRRTTLFLTPIIILDLLLNTFLVIKLSSSNVGLILGFSLAFNVMTWLSTFSFQVEQHKKLSLKFSRKVVSDLIRTCWIRTLFWTAKLIFLGSAFYIYLA